jgi:hypothetical protein
MRRTLIAFVLLSVPLVGPGRAQAQGGIQAEEECCPLLLVPVGARAGALGGAITARAGADAVFVNPAGLARLRRNLFVIHHSDVGVQAQIDAFSLLLAGASSTVGVSYQLFDLGQVPSTDPTGQPTGELSFRDHLLVASFATGLGPGFSAGIGYKLFQNRIDCTGLCGGEESVATTHAADLGVRYNPAWHPALELGAAVINVGFPLRVEPDARSDAFPSRLHVGAAYDLLSLVRDDSLAALRLSLDLQDQLRDPGSPGLAVGFELDMQRVVFLRAGYAPGEGLGTGAAVGIELRYDRFDIAVARSFLNSILEADSEPFQVSFGLHF